LRAAEVSDVKAVPFVIDHQPIVDCCKPIREQANIESVRRGDHVRPLFAGSQQVNKQRCQARTAQDIGHKTIARTMTAAAAAVGEKHYPLRSIRDYQAAVNPFATDINANGLFKASLIHHT